MSSVAGQAPTTREPDGSRRFGYVVAIAINALVLYLVHHFLDWGWPRFLTEDFEEILPILTVSILATMAVNAMFIVYDAAWFQSLCNAATSAISLAVAVRTYQVFPFDFSGYARDWSWLARLIVVISIVGTSVAIVVNVVKFIGSLLTLGISERR